MRALLVRRPHPGARHYADDLTGVLASCPRPEAGCGRNMAAVVGLADIQRARVVIDDVISPTPVLSAGAISRWTGTHVLLKAESLQRTGSFKLRGATNRMATLSEAERTRGVVAAAPATTPRASRSRRPLSASRRASTCRSTPRSPSRSPPADYGAEVVLAGETYEESYAAALADPEGRVLVPPLQRPGDHRRAGHGRARDARAGADADVIVVPLGGGGLLSGIAVAVKALRPDVRVVGVPAAASASWTPSLAAGRPVEIERGTTVADGIAVQLPGDLTFPLVQQFVDDVVEVSEDEIAAPSWCCWSARS